MKILLDAMGGDNAPDANIKGAIKAIKEIKSEIVLVGNEKIIKSRIKELYGKDGVLNAEFISERRGLFDNLIMSINYIVGVIIISSGMLAFIVLYNLTNININERRREDRKSVV